MVSPCACLTGMSAAPANDVRAAVINTALKRRAKFRRFNMKFDPFTNLVLYSLVFVQSKAEEKKLALASGVGCIFKVQATFKVQRAGQTGSGRRSCRPPLAID